ncbi:MAG: T9SS type A sorting domain-containing protein, partial [candidate division WOR-3 bacterium]
GSVTLPIRTTMPDTLFVTVTGRNYKPYEGFALVYAGVEEGFAQPPLKTPSLRIYSNPSRAGLQLQGLNLNSNTELKIYNSTGQLVGNYSKILIPGQWVKVKLSPGVYFVKFSSGDQAVTRKVVVIE